MKFIFSILILIMILIVLVLALDICLQMLYILFDMIVTLLKEKKEYKE